jgi:dTDP-4-dehydrorhamnose 3,5-epimerase
MIVREKEIRGVYLIEPVLFPDGRGLVMEPWHAHRYREAGIPGPFVQDCYSLSTEGVLRGLHYQLRNPQGKLVQVLRGKVFDVAVDIRRGSPTFGHFVTETLSGDNHRQVYIPPGLAHGYCVVSGSADVIYKCTAFYAADDQYGLRWSDPGLGIPWPVVDPVLSASDRGWPTLDTIAPEHLPEFAAGP